MVFPGRVRVGIATVMITGLVVTASMIGLARAAERSEALAAIRNVGSGGQGNKEAAAAWEMLAAAPASDLPEILAAFKGANPLAANWLRGAVEAVADRELKKTGKLPVKALEKFIRDTEQDPRARRLAYEWALKVDPAVTERLIPGMLQDPSVEFRRDAVALLLTEADKLITEEKNDAALALYLKALDGARDDDQVQGAVKPLAKLGHKVDLPRHFGFIQDWRIIGPFDNAGNKGVDVNYPPESGFEPDAKYAGQKGEVTWAPIATAQDYGIVDIAKLTEAHKGAITYAYTEFTLDKAQDLQIRLGTPNAYKVWVNGELLFARGEYHRGMSLDQYILPVQFKAGKNAILLKVCQNEQTEDWAQRWQFQLRVCDATGTAVLSTTRPAPVQAAALETPAAQ